MSICFRRYAGSSTVIPGLGQSSFLALYLRMDFNNTPTSLAYYPAAGGHAALLQKLVQSHPNGENYLLTGKNVPM